MAMKRGSLNETLNNLKAAKLDVINHPLHYTTHPSGIECITIIEWFNFNLGNVIKYIWRSDKKGRLEDLKKAQFYLNREIKRLESDKVFIVNKGQDDCNSTR